jgi:peptidyl-prolyl cis-trans isomerase SurA
MFKILKLETRTEAHTADISKDYVKVQNLALQKKKAETIDEWAKDKIKDTYIKINDSYLDCGFESNWAKK